MEYRFAAESDLDLLAEWNHELIRDEGHRNPMTVRELRERMRGWLAADYQAVVFLGGGGPVAYALYRESADEVYLRQLFVRRDRRRAGHGRRAMAFLRESIWPAQKRLTVEVLCRNSAAIQFWRAMGYQDYCLTLEIMPAKESVEQQNGGGAPTACISPCTYREQHATTPEEKLETYLGFSRTTYPEKDSAHDFRHIERICTRLRQLTGGMTPPPVLHRLHFLAAFHGCYRKLDADAEYRAEVIDFLRKTGWEEPEIAEAFESLRRHLVDPQTVEEKIVHDANFVELLGAFGIAKAFTVGGAFHQSYEETVDIFESRYLDKVIFQTPAGQALAAEKRAYAKDFLNRLRDEW